MYSELVNLETIGKPIRVGVAGAGGAMGRGIAMRIAKILGMRLVVAADTNPAKAQEAARLSRRAWRDCASEQEVQKAMAAGEVVVTTDILPILARGREVLDIFVEATNTVGFAGRAAETALRNKIDVVLMNAEIDSFLGPLLHEIARESGAIVTSDAGDQHGVLMRMIDEIQLWGFEVVMAGNIKGYLDRYATPNSIVDEAKKRNLNPVMCAAFTDGTKLNIEMALIANASGLKPTRCGMLGPKAQHVSEVFEKFNLEELRRVGVVDYILGAEPGGGVFVIGYSDEPIQRGYLEYYKMGRGPYYLFYRPYHLGHLETPYAISTVYLHRQPIFSPLGRRVADVVAFAKKDLLPNTVLGAEIPETYLLELYRRQEDMLKNKESKAQRA
jgi:predicted homoserine dehydrogenase-like protein